MTPSNRSDRVGMWQATVALGLVLGALVVTVTTAVAGEVRLDAKTSAEQTRLASTVDLFATALSRARSLPGCTSPSDVFTRTGETACSATKGRQVMLVAGGNDEASFVSTSEFVDVPGPALTPEPVMVVLGSDADDVQAQTFPASAGVTGNDTGLFDRDEFTATPSFTASAPGRQQGPLLSYYSADGTQLYPAADDRLPAGLLASVRVVHIRASLATDRGGQRTVTVERWVRLGAGPQ